MKMNYKLRQLAKEKIKNTAIVATCGIIGLGLVAGLLVLPYVVKKQ